MVTCYAFTRLFEAVEVQTRRDFVFFWVHEPVQILDCIGLWHFCTWDWKCDSASWGTSHGWFEASSTVEVKWFVGDVATDFHAIPTSCHAHPSVCGRDWRWWDFCCSSGHKRIWSSETAWEGSFEDFLAMVLHNRRQTEFQMAQKRMLKGSARVVEMVMVQNDPSYSTMTKLLKMVTGCETFSLLSSMRSSGKHYVLDVEALVGDPMNRDGFRAFLDSKSIWVGGPTWSIWKSILTRLTTANFRFNDNWWQMKTIPPLPHNLRTIPSKLRRWRPNVPKGRNRRRRPENQRRRKVVLQDPSTQKDTCL